MTITEILTSKNISAKEKPGIISPMILENKKLVSELLQFAQTAKDSDKATCIECLEYATRQNPAIANKSLLDFVSENLAVKAPRIKWESAKVVGHIAHLFPKQLDMAIGHLLTNTEHTGTVVRWSAAFALCEILGTPAGTSALRSAIENICEREEKKSIKKIYEVALKAKKKNIL